MRGVCGIAIISIGAIVFAMSSSASAQRTLSVEDCIYVRDTASIAQCARNACARAVRASLPLPTTVSFPHQHSSAGGPDQKRTEVVVDGTVRYQVDAGPHVESTYSCHVENNIVLKMQISKPNSTPHSDARDARGTRTLNGMSAPTASTTARDARGSSVLGRPWVRVFAGVLGLSLLSPCSSGYRAPGRSPCCSSCCLAVSKPSRLPPCLARVRRRVETSMPFNSAAHPDARPAPCLINRHRSRAGGCER